MNVQISKLNIANWLLTTHYKNTFNSSLFPYKLCKNGIICIDTYIKMAQSYVK